MRIFIYLSVLVASACTLTSTPPNPAFDTAKIERAIAERGQYQSALRLARERFRFRARLEDYTHPKVMAFDLSLHFYSGDRDKLLLVSFADHDASGAFQASARALEESGYQFQYFDNTLPWGEPFHVEIQLRRRHFREFHYTVFVNGSRWAVTTVDRIEALKITSNDSLTVREMVIQ